MGDILLAENLNSNPSSPPEGLLKRVNDVPKIADANGNMVGLGGLSGRGTINDLPSTLQEREIFLVDEDVQGGPLSDPTMFCGPPGGGTPKMITDGVNIYVQLNSNFVIPKGGGGGFPPNATSANDGIVSVSKSSTGKYVNDETFDATFLEGVTGVTVGFDFDSSAFYRVFFRVTNTSNPDIEISTYDSNGNLSDADNLDVVVPISNT